MSLDFIAGYELGRMGFQCPPFVSDAVLAGFGEGQMSLVTAGSG